MLLLVVFVALIVLRLAIPVPGLLSAVLLATHCPRDSKDPTACPVSTRSSAIAAVVCLTSLLHSKRLPQSLYFWPAMGSFASTCCRSSLLRIRMPRISPRGGSFVMSPSCFWM